MAKISVIVPVYNVSQYLRKCVDSIIHQTFHDLEIILVDDGSTDDSGTICDAYATMDSRIKVIHKKNGGLSDARNAGLDICTGDYIGFVDSDDYIAPNMYEVLYKQAIEENADVSGCQRTNIYENDKILVRKRENNKFCKENNIVFKNQVEIIGHMFCKGGNISVCDKIFKRDIFKSIHFDVGKYYEDAFILMKWIRQCSCFVFNGAGLYYYVQRAGSITHLQKFNDKGFDVIRAYQYNLDIIQKEFPEAVPYGEARLWWAYRIALERVLASVNYREYEPEVKKIQKILRKNAGRILGNPDISGKGKAGFLLAMANGNLYQWAKKRYNKMK